MGFWDMEPPWPPLGPEGQSQIHTPFDDPVWILHLIFSPVCVYVCMCLQEGGILSCVEGVAVDFVLG